METGKEQASALDKQVLPNQDAAASDITAPDVNAPDSATAAEQTGSSQETDTPSRARILRGMFFAFVGSSCWGFSASCVSFLTDRYGVGVLWLADTRLFAAGLLFIAAALIRDRDKFRVLFSDRRLMVRMVAYSLIAVVLMQIGYMNAIKYTNAGTALLLLELSIPMVLVYECIHERRMPTLVEIIAIVLAFLGVLSIATQGNIGSLGISALGLIFGIMAAIANAGYILISKRLVHECGSLVVNGVGMTLAAIILLPFGRPWEVPTGLDSSAWIAIVAIILVGTMAAYAIFLRGIADAGTVLASLIGVFEPVSGAIISALWLGTVFSGWDFLGGAAIIAMMILVALKPE